MTDQIEAFTASLREHLQPKLDQIMNLELWARICVAYIDGTDEDICYDLSHKLQGFDVESVNASDTDFATWTPKCSLSMNVEIKDYGVFFVVNLTHSTIISIDFDADFLSEISSNIDLVKEFERKQFMLALSK